LRNQDFIWDEEKHRANVRKHGVTFNEAATVFDDEAAIYFEDASHSQGEERFVIIGYSERARMLMVCHCYRGEGSVIRLISARKANSRERAQYGRR
jgi:hypothetical protein